MAQPTALSPALSRQPLHCPASFCSFPFCQILQTAARVILFRKSKAVVSLLCLNLPVAPHLTQNEAKVLTRPVKCCMICSPVCLSLISLLSQVLAGSSQPGLLIVLPLSQVLVPLFICYSSCLESPSPVFTWLTLSWPPHC